MGLREVRFHKRVNQWDIALKTGIHQSTLSRIENGYLKPKEKEKKKIARALGCSVIDVFPEHAHNG